VNLEKQSQGLTTHSKWLLNHLRQRLEKAATFILAEQNSRLHYLRGRLCALSPQEILNRGYALVTCPKTGSIIYEASANSLGDKVWVRLAKGKLLTTVEEIDEKN
ncbi:MAG: exodeoxyribonuclease VII large subunit, partial [Candidatus Adiutrix sp.]